MPPYNESRVILSTTKISIMKSTEVQTLGAKKETAITWLVQISIL